MSDERRHHFEWNVIKKSIIDLILRDEGPVNEPDVSNFLKKEYGEFNRSTINKHLHTLVEFGCIEQVKPKDKSKFNFYDVNSLENLKNIQEHFLDIQLNECEKVLMIILRKFEINIHTIYGVEIYLRLFLSASFFDMFLNLNSLDALKNKIWTNFEIDLSHRKYPGLIEETKENQRRLCDSNWGYLLFEYCRERDVYDGTAKDDEIKFSKLHYIVQTTVEMYSVLYNRRSVNVGFGSHTNYKCLSRLIYKYEQPKFYYRKDQKEIEEILKNTF